MCRLLEVQKQENGGAWPETVAVVLWGTDNIKTYGESLAQVSTPPQPLNQQQCVTCSHYTGAILMSLSPDSMPRQRFQLEAGSVKLLAVTGMAPLKGTIMAR